MSYASLFIVIIFVLTFLILLSPILLTKKYGFGWVKSFVYAGTILILFALSTGFLYAALNLCSAGGCYEAFLFWFIGIAGAVILVIAGIVKFFSMMLHSLQNK